jgi:pyochelin biosynthetic protein PchC
MSGDPWLRVYCPQPAARMRLVCFPHASGSATFYREWAIRLAGSAIEVVAVQYPGRLDRISEPLPTDMETIADAIVKAVADRAGGRVALFGHSMGAAVAYEVAHRLEYQHGSPPACLFVSGYPGPPRYRGGSKHTGSDELLQAELIRLGGTDPLVHNTPELLAAVIPVLRADYRIIETYRPTLSPTLTVPVAAFTGDRDPDAPIGEVAQWRAATTGPFRLRIFAGAHFYLVDQADVVHAELRSVVNAL